MASVPGTRSWRSLGPFDTRTQFDGTYYFARDTGRLSAIRVDPTDAITVYLAASGGGVWKTTDFDRQSPDWTPLSENFGALTIGAMDIDPQNRNILYVGTGDAFDQTLGGAVQKSVDGGATWGFPVALSTFAQAVPLFASSIRQLMVDPTDSFTVYATTDVGLFRSNDGGSSWNYVSLPNTPAYNTVFADDLEATWDIVYLGGTQFAVSGVYACPGFFPASPGSGSGTCASSPGAPAGNIGDIWTTMDGGATWQSVRVGGRITTALPSAELGRIALGAAPGFPGIYAEAGNRNEAASSTSAILRSTDGGQTFKVIATSATAVTNPTLTSSDCTNMNLGHSQSWKTLAVAVDPTNSDHVLFGGDNCAVRTVDGGTTWQNVAHRLPSSGLGTTASGPLPYVHGNWHTALASATGGKIVVLAGTEGGLFRSDDVFSQSEPAAATWQFPDAGLVTHIVNNLGTGDPEYGSANILYAGFQSIGMRWRLSETGDEAALNPSWNQLIGGNGAGAAVTNDPQGQNRVYWASIAGGKRFCQPGLDAHDCGAATRIVDDHEIGNWSSAAFTLPGGDSEPFLEKFSAIDDADSSVLTASTLNVWKLRVTSDDTVVPTRLSPSGLFGRTVRGQGVFASPLTYSLGGVPSRVYGVCLSSGFFATLVDDGSGSFAPVQSVGVLNANGQSLTLTQSIAFPRDPLNLGGTAIRSTYVVSSVSQTDAAGAPIQSATGRIFKTTDNGMTWTPIHGNGTGFDLPNVAVNVVRFDYSDLTDQTLYAGTDLGLYRTTDGGQTWARYGNGLPFVRVSDVSVSLNGSLVRASTWGRGVWEIYPHSEADAAPGNGDWNRDGVIDFFDLSALTSRWGTNPSTTARPLYDSTLDRTLGTGNLIDDTDLNDVLTKFGGAP